MEVKTRLYENVKDNGQGSSRVVAQFMKDVQASRSKVGDYHNYAAVCDASTGVCVALAAYRITKKGGVKIEAMSIHQEAAAHSEKLCDMMVATASARHTKRPKKTVNPPVRFPISGVSTRSMRMQGDQGGKERVWLDVAVTSKTEVPLLSCSVHATSSLRQPGAPLERKIFPEVAWKEGSNRSHDVRFDLHPTEASLKTSLVWIYLFHNVASDDAMHTSDAVYSVTVLEFTQLSLDQTCDVRARHVVDGRQTGIVLHLMLGAADDVALQPTEHTKAREKRPSVESVERMFASYVSKVKGVESLYESACSFPSGKRVRAPNVARYVYSPLCRTPLMFFFLETLSSTVTELYPSGCDKVVHNLINVVCCLEGISTATYKSLSGDKLRGFLAKVVTLVGSVIAYTPDYEGEFFSKPHQYPSLGRAQADCEDLAILNMRMVQMIENTTGDLAAPLRDLLSHYVAVACLITSRGSGKPGDEEGASADTLHQVAILLPRKQLDVLSMQWKERAASREDINPDLQPILLECMVNVQPTVLKKKAQSQLRSEPFRAALHPFITLQDMRDQGIYTDMYRLYVCDWRSKGEIGYTGEFIPVTRRGKAYGGSFVEFLCDPLGVDLTLVRAASISKELLRDVTSTLYDETRYLDSTRYSPKSDLEIVEVPVTDANDGRKSFLRLLDASVSQKHSASTVHKAVALAEKENHVTDLNLSEGVLPVYLCGDVRCQVTSRKDYSLKTTKKTTTTTS